MQCTGRMRSTCSLLGRGSMKGRLESFFLKVNHTCWLGIKLLLPNKLLASWESRLRFVGQGLIILSFPWRAFPTFSLTSWSSKSLGNNYSKTAVRKAPYEQPYNAIGLWCAFPHCGLQGFGTIGQCPLCYRRFWPTAAVSTMLHSEQISHQPNLCQYNGAKDNKKLSGLKNLFPSFYNPHNKWNISF